MQWDGPAQPLRVFSRVSRMARPKWTDRTRAYCSENVLRPTRKTWACRRYYTAWVDSENALTSWQVRYVELLEIDFSVECSRFDVLEVFPRRKNPVVATAEPYGPSAPTGSKCGPTIVPSTGHGPAFPDGGGNCVSNGVANTDAP